jgi:uncharacterized repeat protein (TIGR04138 family)
MDPPEQNTERAEEILTEKLDRAAAKSGYPVEAVRHALNVLSWAPYDPYAVQGQLSASDFCRAYLELAMDSFLDQTEATLREWRIERSEDLGRIVDALVDEGLVKAGDEDRREDFDGIFDLKRRHFGWKPAPTEEERLRKEERENRSITLVMTALGVLAALGCVVLADGAEPKVRFVLIVLAVSALLTPWLLHLLVAHGYRRVRSRLEQPPAKTDSEHGL